jgi:zinc transport system substrate-binding protein
MGAILPPSRAILHLARRLRRERRREREPDAEAAERVRAAPEQTACSVDGGDGELWRAGAHRSFGDSRNARVGKWGVVYLERVKRFAFVLALAAATSGCGGCKGKTDTGRLHVVASIFPVYDLTRQVAGPDADVSLLLPPGHNEHTFDPTPHEVEEVARSKVAVMVGLGLDPWMEKLVKDASPGARVLKLGDRVPTRTIDQDMVGDEEVDKAREKEEAAHAGHEEHEHEKGAVDPHVWLDPQRARLMVKAIGEELARADAAHANGYRERATEADRRLEALDKETLERTKAWRTRSFVTFHGSFGYFAERYELKILAVIEPFPGSSPTGEYIQAVLKVVGDKKVPALYSEPQLDARPAKIIADAAKVPLGQLDPVGGGPETDTYEKLIRYNVAALEQYLK